MSLEIEMTQHRCRICLENCRETISVYDEVVTGVSYLDITLKLTNQLKLDGSSNELLHICVSCATMAKTAYNSKEPCVEADYKLEIEEEIITEEKIKLEKIKDENITSNCSTFSVKEEIHIMSKNEQTHEASLKHVTIKEALEVYYENPCDKTLDYHSTVVHKQEELQCDYCEYVPQSLHDYTKHAEAEHADKRTKNCNYCGKSFNDSRTLKDHLRSHSNTKSYECYDCGSKFAFKNRLVKHLKGHEQEKRHIASKKCDAYENKLGQVAWFPYACKICNRKFQVPASLRKHNKVAHNSHDKSCFFCAFLPKSPAELITHMKQEHSENRPWACKDCGKTYFQRQCLKLHSLIHKDTEGKHMCNVCGRKIYSKSSMMVHMRSHTGEKPFSCSECDSKFSCLNYLTKHMKTQHCDSEKEHAGKKYFACDKCDGAFTSVQNLKAHLLLHGGTKNYECTICNFKSTKKFDLITHLRKHSGEKPFQCSNCGKAFKHYKTMRIHLSNQRCEVSINKTREGNPKNRKRAIIKHTASIYACKVCDKTFSSRGLVRRHSKNVHKINDTSCFFCDYVPTSKNGLQKHLEREHEDKKTLSCKHCDKSFFDDIGLAKHVAVHNTIVNNVCKICGCKFAMESDLIKHMIIHTATISK